MALDYTTPAEALSESTTLFDGLISGLPPLPVFPVPAVVAIPPVPELPLELIGDVTKGNVDELTSGDIGGDGIFDKIMSSLHSHVEGQYHKGIIGQSDVAAIYVAAIQSALPQSIQFLLSGEQSFWAAKLVQIQAQNAFLERSRLIAEVEIAKLSAYKVQAEAAAAQTNAITAQAQYANAKLQLSLTLQQINSMEVQQALNEANFDEAWTRTRNTLPNAAAVGGHTSRDFDLKEAALITAGKQAALLDAQTNVQRAQTYNTNTDTTTVAGVIGVQKALYEQQIESYVNDGKNKGVKMVADLWTSAKALDDATQSPGPLAGNLIMAMNKYLNDLGLPHAYNNPDTPATGAPSADADPYTPGDQ